MFLEPQSKFSCSQLERLLLEEKNWRFSPETQKRIESAASVVQDLASSSNPIYGINTGFGRMAQFRISPDQLEELQINLLRSHASGIGEALSPKIVRRLLLLRVLSLGKGHSGVSVQILNRHLDYLREGLIPYIPNHGSVGASGDLAPLAHLGLTFIGEGYFLSDSGEKIPTKKVLEEFSWKPISIGPKEGLSLTNGTQFSLALGLEVLDQLRKLLTWMEAATAMSIEAFRATDAVYLEKIHALKAHSYQQEIARRLRFLLKDSPHMQHHKDCELVQDPYSFRCIPQILGPCYALVDQAETFLEAELNSVSDNPLVFPDDSEILSCGHFHAHFVSMACDLLAMAMTSMGNLIERRIDQIVNPLVQRLPGFLASQPGLESGLMIVHTACAALASENKVLSFPASADSIPTNGNQEDHVSMAPNAARKAGRILQNLRRLVAAEILCGVRACVIESTRTGQKFSRFIESFLHYLSDTHPELFLSGDRVFGEDWARLEERLMGEFPTEIAEGAGP